MRIHHDLKEMESVRQEVQQRRFEAAAAAQGWKRNVHKACRHCTFQRIGNQNEARRSLERKPLLCQNLVTALLHLNFVQMVMSKCELSGVFLCFTVR